MRAYGSVISGGPLNQRALPYPIDPTLAPRRTNRDHDAREALLTTHGIREAHVAGQGVHAIAERFQVSLNAVRHIINGGTI